MKVNKHLVSLLLLALLASCFLFGAVAPQDATADSEDAAVDTKDDDSSDATGPSDLEQQEADTATDSSSNGANPMMAPPTGGAGIAFNKGKNVSTSGTPSATGAGTGMTGGAKLVGGAKIKQQINLEGVTKDVIEENKLNVERALASSLGLDIGAVQITSVDESTAAAQPTEQ